MPRAVQRSSLAGSFRLFQIAGISIYMHWSWLLVAVFELQTRANLYVSPVWNVIEYLSLFGIVLLHELGHALACRQVGGRASEIVLWPLGGIAYVHPPSRPGAFLWSIAAGPLVNVILVPATIGTRLLAQSFGWRESHPDFEHFLASVTYMNAGLLIFNLLPIYPLDGGQIVQALLWFIIGRARSLLVVSVLGMLAGVAVIGLAVMAQDWWIGLLALFVASRGWVGFQYARLLARLTYAPRHQHAACPSCQAHPLVGALWGCNQCGTRFDTFEHQAMCPGCGKAFPSTECVECLQSFPIVEWLSTVQKPAITPAQESGSV